MEDLKQEARKFLVEQFAIMSRHGNAPNIGDARMEELIAEAECTFHHLGNPQGTEESEDLPLVTAQ